MPSTAPSLSEEETLKADSDYLRGSIAASLADAATGAMDPQDAKLLKFHGSYQQDDRDLRLERQRQKLEPAYGFLVRLRIPGGVLSPEQWLKLDELACRYGNGSLRITSRQTFQFHGVRKRHLKALMAGLQTVGLDSIAACGDVNRNVVAHNNPYLSPLHRQLHGWARCLSEQLLPKTRAYQEIWLDGEKLGGPEEEPLYGKTYLPRKFKIGLALPPDNDIDVFAQDLGLIAIAEGGELQGFNVAVGGGMGMSHGDTATYPRLADVIGFCPPQRLLQLAETVLAIQRDHGDRGNRKHARFKYTLDQRGLDWFRAELEQRLGWALEPARPFRFEHSGDRHGWGQDEQGLWHLTLVVPSGRLRDTETAQWLTALREIAGGHRGDFRLTANQNLIIAEIESDQKSAIQSLLARCGIPDASQWSGLRRQAMSCVAFPTCGLAMAESERWLPTLLGRLEPLFAQAGLEREAVNLRVTGCPNGCARPYLGEIGLVGKAPGRYNLYLGAAFNGSRLNKLYRDNLSEDEIVATLAPVIERYGRERQPGETFGDFTVRAGYVALDR
jgi:sulfite reductase (NADPH) hemoprotein beta-component